MAWVDLAFYHDVYLLGDDPLIPDKSFPRWEQTARERINRNHVEFDGEPPVYIKKAVCAVAEILYEQKQRESPTAVQSFSNDGYSVSYARQDKTQSDVDARINAAVVKYIALTEWHNDFVFTGVR